MTQIGVIGNIYHDNFDLKSVEIGLIADGRLVMEPNIDPYRVSIGGSTSQCDVWSLVDTH